MRQCLWRWREDTGVGAAAGALRTPEQVTAETCPRTTSVEDAGQDRHGRPLVAAGGSPLCAGVVLGTVPPCLAQCPAARELTRQKVKLGG